MDFVLYFTFDNFSKHCLVKSGIFKYSGCWKKLPSNLDIKISPEIFGPYMH